MASPKEYAYYLKGNKIAIVEKHTSFNNDPNSRNYGPGARDMQYESPLSNVSEGLELEYTYSPVYNLAPQLMIGGGSDIPAGGASYSVFGWTVVDGYLAFVTQQFGADLSAAGYNEELGTEGEDYIVIKGSGRWNGVHKVKTRGTEGLLVTNTKVPSSRTSSIAAHTFDDTADTIVMGTDANTSSFELLLTANETSYIAFQTFSAALAANNRNKILKGTWDGAVTFSVDSVSEMNAVGTAWEDEATITLAAETVVCNLYKVYKDNCRLYGKNTFTYLQDENFELDLPRYLSRAVVFYLKAKFYEDTQNLEMHEYYMRQFKKQVEKHNTSKGGSHRVIQGFGGLR